MIKFLLGVIVALALIGGAVKFESDDESWQIIIHKKEALHSIQNGAIRIYNIVEELIAEADVIQTSTLVLEE
ncbi:MAG TPA: hypothetical protein EYG22_07385 [Candidatus Thioglobus sp.]|nr:hypothetical protein [Candidatus Thioglobus sp.]HIL21409.1 hypothetical protein [Candidatus Thioglobus sp.]